MKIKFYPEICCDYCDEIIHNHFDCPSCDKKYAGTSFYHEIEKEDTEFECESCNARFTQVSSNDGFPFYGEWEQV